MIDSAAAVQRLRRDVEDLFYVEADLLDHYEFERWLDLFTEDVRYWMPISRDVRTGGPIPRYGTDPLEVAWFDEGKATLTQRVQQLATGVHWAEEPLSRTSHLVTNVRVLEVTPSIDAAERLLVRSRFLVYRNRLQDEQDLVVGKRVDELVSVGEEWRIRERTIYLDQNVLLSKNLSFFL